MSTKVVYKPAPPAGSPSVPMQRNDPFPSESAEKADANGSQRKNRLEFLDFLRCVAAFSVLIQHACEKVSPAFVGFCTNYFQFGVFGVTLFFLSSGFVIPVSLEKSNSLKKFWINRAFRLYPLYLVSIGSTLLFIAVGISQRPMPPVGDIIANLTMLQKFMGRPSIYHLYWTLCLEMLFYIIVSALFLGGFLKKTAGIVITSLAVTLLIGVVGTQVFHLFTSGWGTAFYLSTMFMGFLFYRLYKQQVPKRIFAAIYLATLAVLLLITWFNLWHKDQPEFMGTLSFLPVTLSMLSAYAVFSLCYAFRSRQYPSFLLLMGVISYSLYLVQGTVFAMVPAIGSPVVSVLAWLVIITLISWLTYNLVEKPFITIGKRTIQS